MKDSLESTSKDLQNTALEKHFRGANHHAIHERHVEVTCMKWPGKKQIVVLSRLLEPAPVQSKVMEKGKKAMKTRGFYTPFSGCIKLFFGDFPFRRSPIQVTTSFGELEDIRNGVFHGDDSSIKIQGILISTL